jgi:CDP-diacylglycerol--glycerol-3-phosphate 3-phosphatidyltransferase
MNLPNKLTILRTIMIPFFLVALLCDEKYGGFIPYGNWIALVIFALASLTDMLDGKIARKYNLITDFGKFMDPLADKLLVASAMIAFVELDRIPCWVVIIIIAREFIISGFRLVAADNGIVIAAGIWGKVKTAEQMVMLCILIADLGSVFPAISDGIYILEQVLIYVALILTIVSLVDYLVHNKNVLAQNNI